MKSPGKSGKRAEVRAKSKKTTVSAADEIGNTATQKVAVKLRR